MRTESYYREMFNELEPGDYWVNSRGNITAVQSKINSNTIRCITINGIVYDIDINSFIERFIIGCYNDLIISHKLKKETNEKSRVTETDKCSERGIRFDASGKYGQIKFGKMPVGHTARINPNGTKIIFNPFN